MTTLQATELDKQQGEWIDSLRELADFLEAHPDLIPVFDNARVIAYARTADEFALLARQLGTAEKDATDRFAELKRKFGPHALSVITEREQVCERVQVGEQEVVRQVLPEGVEFVEETVTEPVYEWVCQPWLEASA